MGCEQTIPLDVEHCDLMVRHPFSVSFVQNSGTTDAARIVKLIGIPITVPSQERPESSVSQKPFVRRTAGQPFSASHLLRQRDGGHRKQDD